MHNYKLLNILSEQMVFQFSGRVNCLDQKTSQILGGVILKDGQVINAFYKKIEGFKAIFYCLVDEIDKKSIKYVVEPEVVDSVVVNIPYSFDRLSEKLLADISNFEKTRSLKPPDHLCLFIRPDFIVEGEKITEGEYELLCAIMRFNSVGEIYRRTELLDHEITTALVSLRKKNALLVK